MSVNDPKSPTTLSADEKARLVLEGLRAPERLTELCRSAGLSEEVLRGWCDAFVEGGTERLVRTAQDTDHRGALSSAICRKIIASFPSNLLVSCLDNGEILFRSASTEATYGQRKHTREHWASQEARKLFVDQMQAKGRVENMFFRARRHDDTEFPAQLSSRLIEHDGKTISITTSTDLSKARKMSREIEQANLRLNEAMEAVEDGLLLWDKDFRLAMYNARFLELFGIRGARPLTGIGIEDLQRLLMKSVVLPEGMSSDSALQGGIAAILGFRKNLQIRTRDGRIITLSTHRTKLDGYLCTFKDVTRRLTLQRELEHEREIVHQNEKLKALGELLAGVAHELNNPLSVVTGYSLMLQERLTDPVNKKRIERIGKAAERCARIVRTFLAMAREETADLQPMSLNEIIEATLEDCVDGLTAKGIRVETDLDASLPLVEADADQIIQVFSNLISNAGHALNDAAGAGVITLRTFYDESQERVSAEVADNGPGVPAELQSRIFDPFFTTKEAGEGTGIGLAFCHRIVDTYGGRIALHSIPCDGARFTVQLPRFGGPRQALRPDDGEACRRRKAVRILVVDDEADVRDLLEDLLTEAVIRVETCANAKNALELLDRYEFDIVLSDIRMPGMNGMEFYTKLIETDPDYADRFAFVTGDLMNAEIAEFIAKSGAPRLEKPVIPAELSALVNHLCARLEGAAP